MFGLDPEGNVWYLQRNGAQLTKINTNSDELKPTSYVVPKNMGIYDTDTDSKGRTDLYIWTEGKIGIFDPRTVEYAEYKTPTPMAGPRRRPNGARDRPWAGEVYGRPGLTVEPHQNRLHR